MMANIKASITIISLIFLFPIISIIHKEFFKIASAKIAPSLEFKITKNQPDLIGEKNKVYKSIASKSNPASQVINRSSTVKKMVALTFDADMTYGMKNDLKNGKIKSLYNEKLINELKKTNTPATLFLSGLWVAAYPDVTKSLSSDPLFEISNHGYSHRAFSKPCYKLQSIGNKESENEIIKTEELFKIYAPNYKKYFRFPGLCYNNLSAETAAKLGYEVIHGDVISGDAFNNNASEIISKVISRVKPGSIIIFHMHGGTFAPKTAEAIPEIIRQLKEKGYSFEKVSALLSEN